MKDAVFNKLTLEFCRRSPAGAAAFAASAIPLILFPLITEKPLYYVYLVAVSLILPINFIRIYLARKILSNPEHFSKDLLFIHSATIVLNAICYGIFIGLVFWTLPMSTLSYTVAIIFLTAISSGSTSSLVLKPAVQNSFLFLVAILPMLELFFLSLYRGTRGYGLIACLLTIYLAYLKIHSKNFYIKMIQLYEYEERLILEKTQLQNLVDDLKKAQDEILTQKARADHSARLAAIGVMASGIAHEINNPLSIIQGHIKHIQTLTDQNNQLNTETKREFNERSEKIQNAVSRIGRIINGLKLFSLQRKDASFESVSFQSIIDNTLELCGERFHLNAIKLEVDKAPDVKVKVHMSQIIQVMHHLLNNAFEAVISSPDPEVRVTMEIKKNYLYVYIKDNGGGVPEEIRNRIFIPFFTSKEIGKGAGLGLSISRGIIEQHGGMLTLDEDQKNAPGWTTFVFSLPIAETNNHR
ncbi:MAG: ATP-binding protein [Bacteriovorax sp.]|jgi:signal transduction histidine kinase